MRVAGLPLRGRGDRPLYTFCRWIVLAIFAGLYRCRAEGTQHLPETGPALIAVNHKADFDPVVVGMVFDRPFAYMAKRELFEVPVLGRLISALGAFPIDRGAGDRAALETALKLLADGHVLLMFPEGTRQPDDEIHDFLPGVALLALRSGAPVVPVAVHGTNHMLRGGRPAWPALRVKAGPPVDLSGIEGRGSAAYREAARRMRADVVLLYDGLR
jgi:1-acyl-sn-glycerol-3-phosphate acyltransferase